MSELSQGTTGKTKPDKEITATECTKTSPWLFVTSFLWWSSRLPIRSRAW